MRFIHTFFVNIVTVFQRILSTLVPLGFPFSRIVPVLFECHSDEVSSHDKETQRASEVEAVAKIAGRTVAAEYEKHTVDMNEETNRKEGVHPAVEHAPQIKGEQVSHNKEASCTSKGNMKQAETGVAQVYYRRSAPEILAFYASPTDHVQCGEENVALPHRDNVTVKDGEDQDNGDNMTLCPSQLKTQAQEKPAAFPNVTGEEKAIENVPVTLTVREAKKARCVGVTPLALALLHHLEDNLGLQKYANVVLFSKYDCDERRRRDEEEISKFGSEPTQEATEKEMVTIDPDHTCHNDDDEEDIQKSYNDPKSHGAGVTQILAHPKEWDVELDEVQKGMYIRKTSHPSRVLRCRTCWNTFTTSKSYLQHNRKCLSRSEAVNNTVAYWRSAFELVKEKTTFYVTTRYI